MKKLNYTLYKVFILLFVFTNAYTQTVRVVFNDDKRRTKKICWAKEPSQKVTIEVEFGKCGNGEYTIDWGDNTALQIIKSSEAPSGKKTYDHIFSLTSLNAQSTGLADFEIRITNNNADCNDFERDYDNANFQVHKTIVPLINITAACVGQISTFANNSEGRTNRKGALEWTWTFSNGATSTTLTPPGQRFTSADGQFVTLSVKQDEVCPSGPPISLPIPLTTLPEPVATYIDESTGSPLSETICLSKDTDGVIQLNALQSVNATSYTWTVKNGTSKIIEGDLSQGELKVQLTEANEYIIDVAARNACGTKTISKKVTSKKMPDISLVPQSDGCEEIDYQVSNPVLGAVYSLDGKVFDPVIPLKLTKRTEAYFVVAEVKNECGVQKDEISFFVHSKEPVAITSFKDNLETCKFSDRIELEADKAGGVWKGENIVTIDGKFSFNPIKEGEYSIIYERGEGVCLSKDSKRINVVNSKPEPLIGLDGAATLCAGQEVRFTNLSTNADPTYARWLFGDGSDPLDNPNPVVQHTFRADDKEEIYEVQLIVQNVCGVDTTSRNVRVAPAQITTAFSFDKQEVCVGVPFSFTDATYPKAVAWEWDFGDQEKSVVQNPVHAYTKAGVYTVTLKAQNSCISGNKTHEIKVIEGPKGGFELLTPLLCYGEALRVTNITPTNYKFIWDFGDGSPTNETDFTPKYAYQNSGEYPLTLTIYDGELACNSVIKKQVLVEEPFEADFTVEVDNEACNPALVKLVNNSVGGDKWLWDLGNGNTSTVKDPTIPYYNGQYNITLTAWKGGACETTAVKTEYFQFANCDVKIPEAFTPNGDKIGDRYTLFGEGIQRIKYMRIRNRWGEVVYEMNDVPPGSQNIGESWDGTKNGTPLAADMYVFEAQLLYRDNTESEVVKGSFYLVR